MATSSSSFLPVPFIQNKRSSLVIDTDTNCHQREKRQFPEFGFDAIYQRVIHVISAALTPHILVYHLHGKFFCNDMEFYSQFNQRATFLSSKTLVCTSHTHQNIWIVQRILTLNFPVISHFNIIHCMYAHLWRCVSSLWWSLGHCGWPCVTIAMRSARLVH